MQNIRLDYIRLDRGGEEKWKKIEKKVKKYDYDKNIKIIIIEKHE